MRKVINDVYDNTTLSTVMGKIYSEAGIDKILISPIDNDKSYPKIIIPPINLYDLPKYIETVYGTYYTGTVQFLDYRCMYILSRSGVCDAYEDGEYKRTIFIIKKSNSSMSYRVGTSEDSESKVYYIYTENDNISFSTPSASNDAITGNNVSILDAHGNETTSVEGVGNQRGSGNERVYQDNYGNDFNKTTILADINESNCQATIVLMDYNEEAITPNKEFLIVFEDTKHNKNNGFYRLIGSEIGLVKTGEQLDITGKHTFVYKAPIDQELADKIIASTKVGVKPTEAKTPVEKPTSTDLSGTVPAVPASTPTSGPIPKNIEGTDPTPVSVSNSQTPQRNSNFSYDDLGNVKGVDIPEYNIITSDDDILVTNAKKEAQANLLPCEGPKPKEVNF